MAKATAQIISLIYIIFFCLFMALSGKIKTSKNQMYTFLFFLCLSFAILAYNMDADVGWDISRHSIFMDQIRSSEMSLSEFLFHNKSIGFADYTKLYTFNLMRYLMVHISKENYLLPAVCVFIDYAIVGYIMIDWSLSTQKKIRLYPLSLLLCLCFLPYGNCVSGMRNGLCAAILALGLYQYLYKKRSILIFGIFSFLAATIHPAALITIPFVLVARFNWKVTGYVAVFVLSILAQTIAKRMSQSKYAYLRLIGRKYFSYTAEDQYFASRAPLYTVLLLITIFLSVYFIFICYKKKEFHMSDTPKDILFRFLSIYMLYILGNIGNYDMVLRPAYVLGPLCPILCSWLTDRTFWIGSMINGKIKYVAGYGAILACAALGMYLNYKFAIDDFKHFIPL